MKVTYTGKSGQLNEAQTHKLEARFAKLARLLDTKGEREARVILSQERHLHHAEITVNYKDNALVVVGSDADQFTALCDAIEKLEKQVWKLRAKRRETKRGSHKEAWQEESEQVIETFVDSGSTRKVYRTNHLDGRKPMTLDEALLEMEQDLDYLVYFDADTQKTSVLVRRRDGNFDLVEA